MTDKILDILVFTDGFDSGKAIARTEYKDVSGLNHTVNGKDSAHNNIVVKYDGGDLIVYGYFDYETFNGTDTVSASKKLVTSLITRKGVTLSASESNKNYTLWKANDTSELVGETYNSINPTNDISVYWKQTTGASNVLTNVQRRVLFYYYDNADTNIKAQLSTKNHAIYLQAVKEAFKTLSIYEEFYYIDNNGDMQLAYAPDSLDDPNVKIDFVYNAPYFSNSKNEDGAYGTTIGNQGTFRYRYNEPVQYKFQDNGSEKTKNKLTATLSRDYEYIKFDGKYYIFVGYKYNNVMVTSSDSDDKFKYDFENNVPAGEFVAVYVEIMPLTVYTSSGGTFDATVTTTKVVDYPYSLLMDVGIATLITEIAADKTTTNIYTDGDVNIKINYVVRGLKVTVFPTSNAGYTITEAQYRKYGEVDYIDIPKGDIPGIAPYSQTIAVYNEHYEFNFEYTDAYILTMKQFMLSSISASATASLYDSKTLSMIFGTPISISEIQAFYDRLTDADATNDYSYDNMTLDLGYNQDMYMYYFDVAPISFVGFYSNGRLLVSLADFESQALVIEGTIAEINALISAATYTSEKALILNVKDGSGELLYSVYIARYSAFSAGNHKVTSDLSLEARYSSYLEIKTQIVGLTPDKGIYNYEGIFDKNQMLVQEVTNADGDTILEYTISTYKELSQTLNNTQNLTNKMKISVGDIVNYNIKTLEGTEYSFVYYYYYKRYPISTITGAGDKDSNWYVLEYNGSTCYYYATTNTIYAEKSESSKVILTNISMTNDHKYVLIESILSYSSATGIAMSSVMLENMEEGEELIIYAKFSQVVKFTFVKDIEPHHDDVGFKNLNANTFNEYFNAAIVFTNPSGVETRASFGNSSELTITIQSESIVKIYPYIATNVSNRYVYGTYAAVYNIENTPIIYRSLENGVFVINTSYNDLKIHNHLKMILEYTSAYTITVDKVIDGTNAYDEITDANNGNDYSPLINVESRTEYVTDDNKYVNDIHYLSFIDTTSTVTTDKNVNIVTSHKSNIMTLSYVFKRSSATGTAYTTQILSTSVVKNDLITNLVFHGWYLNGYLYSQNAVINLPLIKTVGSPAEPEPEGYVIIYNKTTKVVNALLPLMYNGTHYSFNYEGLCEISIPANAELNNFSGSLNTDLGYEYMASDNIKFTASYGTFTKVSYETKPEGSDDKHLVSSAISSNLLGITTSNTSITKNPNNYYTINDETIFNTLYDSKSYLPSILGVSIFSLKKSSIEIE